MTGTRRARRFSKPLRLEPLEDRCLLSYTITDLGVLPGASASAAYGINNFGQVVGDSSFADGSGRAFIWDNVNGLQDLGTLGSNHTSARGINDNGQAAGYSDNAAGNTRAFLWDSGSLQDLGTLGGPRSFGFGVDSSGHITGYADTGTGAIHAFLWNSDTGMQDLGTLGGTYSSGRGINSLGWVTGSADTATGASHVFRYTANGLEDLGTLGGSVAVGQGINDAGMVTGWSYSAAGPTHAFLSGDGGLQDLGTLGGSSSQGDAINNAGDVTGLSMLTTGMTTHAFLYTGGAMTDLNTQIPPDSGWVLYEATGINDAGQIVGFGTFGGPFHAFLLDPGTAPGSGGSTRLFADWFQIKGSDSPVGRAGVADIGSRSSFISPDSAGLATARDSLDVGMTVSAISQVRNAPLTLSQNRTHSSTLPGLWDFPDWIELSWE